MGRRPLGEPPRSGPAAQQKDAPRGGPLVHRHRRRLSTASTCEFENKLASGTATLQYTLALRHLAPIVAGVAPWVAPIVAGVQCARREMVAAHCALPRALMAQNYDPLPPNGPIWRVGTQTPGLGPYRV